MSSNLKYLFIISVVVLILILLINFYIKGLNTFSYPIFIDNQVSPTPLLIKESPDKDIIRCPADVKKCLDGSYVSRVAPNCLFAQCLEDKR